MAEAKDNQKVCAYLDLLGFSYYTLEDITGAENLLGDYETILNQKVSDNSLHPPASYPSVELQKTAERSSIDSFEYFLPFSDSIFIVSSQPNKFIRQLSCFLLDCFKFSTSHLDSFSTNTEDPTKVTRRRITLYKEGEIGKSDREEHWYPLLFRGGLSWGEVRRKDLNSIVDKERKKITNLVGPGVVEAVKLEEKLGKGHKGPRIFCKPEFRQLLRQDTRYLIAPLKGCGHYEILWPAIDYSESNDCLSELSNKFDPLFRVAVILWNSFNHEEYGIHYYKFLRLIVKSTLDFFERTGCLAQARSHISKEIEKVGLEPKRSDLMNSEFI